MGEGGGGEWWMGGEMWSQGCMGHGMRLRSVVAAGGRGLGGAWWWGGGPWPFSSGVCVRPHVDACACGRQAACRARPARITRPRTACPPPRGVAGARASKAVAPGRTGTRTQTRGSRHALSQGGRGGHPRWHAHDKAEEANPARAGMAKGGGRGWKGKGMACRGGWNHREREKCVRWGGEQCKLM